MDQKRAIFILVSGAAVIILLAIIILVVPAPPPEKSSETPWPTYRSDRFGFEMQYPADWTVAEFPDDQIAPRINFYPRKTATLLPLTHHSETPNVSVFPYGFPTEGVFGATRESDAEIGPAVRQGLDYTLADGTVWATYLNLAETPDSWQEFGFLWARAEIQDLEVFCTRNGVRLEVENCDPLGSEDQIVRSGRVDPALRETEVRILKSFRFTD